MTPTILTWPQIAEVLPRVDQVAAMEAAFCAWSQGRAVIPPVGELTFQEPPGDVHIKYGYVQGGDTYVVKIASGFYDNPALGLPSSQGLMLLFDQHTGQLQAVLLDEGRLTDARTGAAGAVAAKHLAATGLEAIGVVGVGTQARCQLDALRAVTPCRRALAWGRDPTRVGAFLADARAMGYDAVAAEGLPALCAEARLIVTTTPATAPLLQAPWIQPGTHITAVGADTADKQELDPAILAAADRVVADSLTQCQTRGEIHRAVAAGALDPETPVELGQVIGGAAPGRSDDLSITVADLTGLATQDLWIACGVLDGWRRSEAAATT